MQKNLDVPKDNNFNQQNQKVYQQTSPKNQPMNWSSSKYNNNTSKNLPISPTAQQNISISDKKPISKP